MPLFYNNVSWQHYKQRREGWEALEVAEEGGRGRKNSAGGIGRNRKKTSSLTPFFINYNIIMLFSIDSLCFGLKEDTLENGLESPRGKSRPCLSSGPEAFLREPSIQVFLRLGATAFSFYRIIIYNINM
jgi:hypothetical protein